MKDRIAQTEQFLGVLYKYEIHAFVLLLTGVGLILHGIREEGFGIVGAALSIFKNKAASNA